MTDLFEIVDAGFAGAELAGDPTVIWRHRTPGGVDAVVTDARLCVGPPAGGVYGDGYCYATPMRAILGAARWIEDACRDEPAGWTRDPRTGRTRVGGVAKSGERAWVCPRHPTDCRRSRMDGCSAEAASGASTTRSRSRGRPAGPTIGPAEAWAEHAGRASAPWLAGAAYVARNKRTTQAFT